MTRVPGQQPQDRVRTRKPRHGGAIALSLAVHLVLLAMVGFNAPKLMAPNLAPPPATDIWLMPRLTPLSHTPPERRAAARRTLPAQPKAEPPKPEQRPTSPHAANARPAQAAPEAAAAPAASGAVKGPPPAPGDQTGVQEALRTSVGCDFEKTVRLTRAERDRCNQTIGEQARAAPAFSGIEINKRARFDAQADADERRRANRTGPMQEQVVGCAGEGSNFGLGCLSDSAVMHVHPH